MDVTRDQFDNLSTRLAAMEISTAKVLTQLEALRTEDVPRFTDAMLRMSARIEALDRWTRQHENDHARALGRIEASAQWGTRTWMGLTLLVSLSGIIVGAVIRLWE